MQHFGYGPGERQGPVLVYRGDAGQVAMTVREQKAFDESGRLLCKNSLDLAHHMIAVNEGRESFTKTDALDWLRSEFGERRAAGAYLVYQEQAAYDRFDRLREHERECGLPDRSQGRDAVKEYDSHDRVDGPDRGGGGFER